MSTILKQAWTFIWHKDKAGRLDYAESLMTHGVTGVDLDEAVQPRKMEGWKFMGDKVGCTDGYCGFWCLDGWILSNRGS